MDLTGVAPVSRRGLLAGAGALIVGFSLSPRPMAQEAQGGPKPTGSLGENAMLDSWIRIDPDNRVTVFTGKAELGQGLKTALIQIAAEELAVAPQAITLITADTDRTPDEGYTAGSQSMQNSGTAILNAAAQVRNLLLGAAAAKLGVPVAELTARDGFVAAVDGRRLSYGELVSGGFLDVPAQLESKLTEPGRYAVIGADLPRVDIPPKLVGEASYVQDLRLPGMVHARVVRPPSYGARLAGLDAGPIETMPGVLKIVRDGSFLAVIAEREYHAVLAMRALAAAVQWTRPEALPRQDEVHDLLRRLPTDSKIILDRREGAASSIRSLEATYTRPYQMHAAIGPSCAVAQLTEDRLTVWTHSQGVYPLRKAIAEMLRVPESTIRCIHMEGAGCYGHNGADDVAADAALLARAFPGRPVRVQWMREQEHQWEPFGPAMVTSAKAGIDGSGNIADWQYEVWSNTHSTRPGGAGRLMPAWHLEQPFEPPPPESLQQPAGGGDRNAIPLYRLPNARVVKQFVPEMPLRVSALRALGAYMNVFSIESFMDELARVAAVDPVAFRLRHLDDPRARDVVRAAAGHFGWAAKAQRAKGRGRGLGFARYKNLAAYTAVAVELEVEHETGRIQVLRAVAAVDCGQVVSPDGVRNQIEGGIVQSASWTLCEAVSFSKAEVTSRDWGSYPILRFSGVLDHVEVHVIDRPGQPFLGAGEAAQGPTAAAIANAVADATGVRIRDLPLTSRRVKQAIGV